MSEFSPVLVAFGQFGLGTTKKWDALEAARFLPPPAAPRRCLAPWCSVWITRDPKIFFISFSGFRFFVSMLRMDRIEFLESSCDSCGSRYLGPKPSSGSSPRSALTSRTLRSISSPYWKKTFLLTRCGLGLKQQTDKARQRYKVL